MNIKRLILFVIASMLLSITAGAQSYSIEIGSYEYLELEPPKGWVRNAYWSCDNGLKLTEASEVGAIVQVTGYFEGSAYVRVSYTYEYLGSYDGNMHASNSSKSYRITCIGGEASISETNVELNIGQSHTLSYSRSMHYGTPKWTSSNEDIVTVNNNGKITAKAPGVATITLDPITAAPCFCDVRVRSVAPTAIEVDPEYVSVITGNTKALKVVFTPAVASAKLTWSSDNESVATVSSSGVVKGISAGETRVRVQTDNGLTAAATIKVIGEPDCIELPGSLVTIQGYDYHLTPVVTPSDSHVILKWKSSDTRILTVDNDGNIWAKNVGTAEITVTTQNNKSATCRIEVKAASEGMDYRNVQIRINTLKSLFIDIDRNIGK